MLVQSVLFMLAATAIAAPVPQDCGAPPPPPPAAVAQVFGGGIDPSLVPDPGVQRGIPNPASNGADCLGINNIAIPCQCPPSQADLISKVQLFNNQGNAQGTPFNFPTDVADQSPGTQKRRVDMLIIALQNFDNSSPGRGCPAAASAPNYVQLQKALAG